MDLTSIVEQVHITILDRVSSGPRLSVTAAPYHGVPCLLGSFQV